MFWSFQQEQSFDRYYKDNFPPKPHMVKAYFLSALLRDVSPEEDKVLWEKVVDTVFKDGALWADALYALQQMRNDARVGRRRSNVGLIKQNVLEWLKARGFTVELLEDGSSDVFLR
jgi:hypothetical protein